MRVSFGRIAAGDGDQSLPRTGYGVRFLSAVQLAPPARPWPVVDCGLKSFLDEPSPHSGNGGGAERNRRSYLAVCASCVSFQQRKGPLYRAG